MPVIYAILFFILTAGAARAQNCTASATGLFFGPVDTLGAGPVDTTGEIEIRCTGLQILGAVRGTVSIGAGSGGLSGGLRQMNSPATATPLRYQIYRNAARTEVWGSSDSAIPGEPLPLASFSVLLIGSGRVTIPVYGRVFGGQGDVAPGTGYQSSFAGIEARAEILFCNVLILCLSSETESFPFIVSADVPQACSVTGGTLDFGATGVLNQNMDAMTQLALRCTASTSATIGLDAGQASSGGQRRMTGAGEEGIVYGLFRDAARSQSWGAIGSGGEALAIGTGANQSITVYGRVPPQRTPVAGLYTDTVVVTVTY